MKYPHPWLRDESTLLEEATSLGGGWTLMQGIQMYPHPRQG